MKTRAIDELFNLTFNNNAGNHWRKYRHNQTSDGHKWHLVGVWTFGDRSYTRTVDLEVSEIGPVDEWTMTVHTPRSEEAWTKVSTTDRYFPDTELRLFLEGDRTGWEIN